MDLNNKLTILNLIYDNKEILFGKFSNTLNHEIKVQKWKEITDQLTEINIFEKDWKYLRDTTWQNWRKRSLEKRNNSLKTGRKCKYDAADEIVYKIMEKNSASPTPDEVDPLETSGTSEDQVLQSIPTETSRSTPAVSPHSNASNSSQPRERLLTDNNDGNNGLRKRKMEVELELAEVKLEIAKRESYKLDLELLKLERELNITRHSTFTLPIVMQSDCKYANVIHGN
ncbi:uncharacterized protein [Choristoneura fumiferana]|uniref:uncharacterized protein n=1 Tax=Choristoneura fumiferana TaxID=7141 RepID=UPI003D15EEE5